jgi:hypothetical protein
MLLQPELVYLAGILLPKHTSLATALELFALKEVAATPHLPYLLSTAHQCVQEMQPASRS